MTPLQTRFPFTLDAPSHVGTFKEQACCLCLRTVTRRDALVSGGGVQVMDFGCVAHRRCYQARYHGSEWERKAEAVTERMTLWEAR